MRAWMLTLFVVLTAHAVGKSLATASPPPFEGTAYPAVPPTKCPDVLGPQGRTVHTPQGLEYPIPFDQGRGGYRSTDSPFRIASCWRGTLHGQPFTLTGYGNTEAMAGVVVRYRGRTTKVLLGSSGGPIAASFSGASVCYLPNPAKGYPYVFSLDMPVISAMTLRQAPCVNSFVVRGVQTVYGLGRPYPLEYGVIRTYP